MRGGLRHLSAAALAKTAGLAIIGWPAPAPRLPLISAAQGPARAAVRAAVLEVLTDPATATLRAPLLIAGADVVAAPTYAVMTRRAAAADAARYPALA